MGEGLEVGCKGGIVGLDEGSIGVAVTNCSYLEHALRMGGSGL